jgi:DNA-binding MarR family transcriptional regulator
MKPYIKYSQEIADEICLTVATSTIGLKKLCKANPHWPDHVNIYRWSHEREDFRNLYARAKEHQQDLLGEESLEIARDDSRDMYTNSKGEIAPNNVAVNRDRLIVDTIKWHTSKLAPKIYGQQKLEISGEVSLLEKFIDKL